MSRVESKMEKVREMPCTKRKQGFRSLLFDEIYTEGNDLLMEWPCQDATSRKESDEVDNDK